MMFSRSVIKSAMRSDVRGMATTPGIKKIGIIGMGLMGHGIAQTAAEKGYEVVAVDANPAQVEKGMGAIQQSLNKIASRAVSKGRMEQGDADKHVEETLAMITGTTEGEQVHDCDLVIEAIVENMDIKTPLYQMLGRVCKEDTIFATNTSSFRVKVCFG
jgi:3-hydroxyacyl-CoA dehydrogenase